jgi:hypothetical protein
MFEITGTDITSLSDGDLRTLVARLALSELRAQGAPLSSVTAGGNQDAADGGLDVRVECPTTIAKPDFVPRAVTGFQVKKPNMSASAIREEMRPGGVLRPVIRELAAASGAYIIVSAQGSVADKPLADRRSAIRDQLHDVAAAEKLHTDFYDRDRLATWVNEYPGIISWVRSRTGLGLSGWSSVGGWIGTTVTNPNTYLFDAKTCLTNERSSERKQLTIGEGIAQIRATLRIPKQCIRLIGLSGLGKTRLVQALFENDVGEDPLDSSLAVYTDYSVETDPTARDMARRLVTRGQRAMLVVDNCNPATHSELALICSADASKVSLLTVEYDVRDDEPERTEVFRLQSASPELVSQWLKQSFPKVSQVDRRTIADFSDGNFRVARAIAETLGKGETLGKLKSRELFERIFHQRNEHDQSLLSAAEELSLLYSVDGEDSSINGELALIGNLRAVGAQPMYAALITLRRRGIVQSRGRWRAILPHAIANPLATYALERIPPADFDGFCRSLTTRMQKSLSRRLGYLHDNAEAQTAVTRWLRPDGPLGDLMLGEDGLQIIINIAPAAPEAVLARIERELDGPNGDLLLAPKATLRRHLIRLIKMLSYDAKMFERVAMLLARFFAAEPKDLQSNSARATFSELFHLCLSGTLASPSQRTEVVRRLAESGDPAQRRCAAVALDGLLKASNFSSSSNFEFGARSRGWGWSPELNRDVWNWYDAAISLAVELAPILDDARDILAGKVRELWSFGTRQDLLEHAAATLVKQKPWIEGWLAFRGLLRYEGKAMPDDVRAKLEAIIEQLKPCDLLHQARAVVLSGNGGWDIVDGDSDDSDAMKPWNKAAKMAQDIGRSLAADPETCNEFLAELLIARNQQRAFECGRGLAEGADDLSAMWSELASQFESADPQKRNATVLGGFIHEAQHRDTTFTSSILEAAIDDSHLGPNLPYLQARVGIDKSGIERLQRAIQKGWLQAKDFNSIANGVVGDSPPEQLAELVLNIAGLPDGVTVAIDILHMHFFRDQDDGRISSPTIVEVGRALLLRTEFSNSGTFHDLSLEVVFRKCCSGSDGEAFARVICTNLCAVLESVHFYFGEVSYVLKGIFQTQPFVALDTFLLPRPTAGNFGAFDIELNQGLPLDDMDPEILRQWADLDPTIRYPLLGRAIPIFKRSHGEESNDLAPLYLQILDYAPDKYAYLGSDWIHLYPRSWTGSLPDILAQRRTQMLKLRGSPHEEVRRWADEIVPAFDRWIEEERTRNREKEESFE